MHKAVNIENLLFESLDTYIASVEGKYHQTVDKHALLLKLVEVGEINNYTTFFVFSENLLDTLRVGRSSKGLLKEGFLIISPVKTNVAVGKGYEVFYCKNDSKITPKNYISFGYIFITDSEDIKERSEDLILCAAATKEEKLLGSKRLVELFPNLYAFFNSQGSRQVLIFNQNVNSRN